MDLYTESKPTSYEASAKPHPVLAPTNLATSTVSRPRTRRSPWKVFLHSIRRGHLYFGLFLFPWAILYGVTAFLFNHPKAFSDQSVETIPFGKDAIAGTPMAEIQTPADTARAVVAELQKRAPAGKTYTLLEPDQSAFTRDVATASVRADGQVISVSFELNGSGGTVRGRPETPDRPAVERAPFAIGGAVARGRSEAAGRGRGGPPANGGT